MNKKFSFTSKQQSRIAGIFFGSFFAEKKEQRKEPQLIPEKWEGQNVKYLMVKMEMLF